ncbi:MAG: RagB/SusD family nutrient uptake outer membrane protein [Rikenellaceae bacterium]|jgi:hypothetical protein|nr:RagB/SusD family nutrient uptake outer membrane protein [Rikenellaceae bacterium]
MKKVISGIFVILAASFTLSSCEDYLKENNRNAMTTVYYNTPEGVQAAIHAGYYLNRTFYYQETPIQMLETGTDLFYKGNDNKQSAVAGYGSDLNGSTGTSGTTLGIWETTWQLWYRGIEWANIALENLEIVPMDAALKKRLTGEANFLRAWYNWHIVETWGPVILKTKPTNMSDPEVLSPKKTPIKDFYTQILADLDVAIANLDGYDPKDGHANIWGAKAFKARVLLYMASEYNAEACGYTADQAKSFATQAATLAAEVIASSGRKLYPIYRDTWDMKNANARNNTESIWYVNYTSNLSFTGSSLTSMVPSSGNGGNEALVTYTIKYDDQAGLTRTVRYGRPFNRVMVSMRALKLFDNTIDQRFNVTFLNLWCVNDAGKLATARAGNYPKMGDIGDTAMLMINGLATAGQKAWAAGRYQILDYTNIYGGAMEPENVKTYSALRGFQMNKFADSTRSGGQDDLRSIRDASVLRLAEMYLIASEAYWRAGDNTNALKYMNELRTTRAVPGKTAEMTVATGDLTLDFFLDENAREFIGEIHRWSDLKRTKKLVEYNQKYNPDGKANIKEHHLLRPIPQGQLDAVLNKDEFKQNPGYDK